MKHTNSSSGLLGSTRFKAFLFLLAAALVFPAIKIAKAAGNQSEPVASPKTEEARQARVQIALLLDTSGSMSGLIEQAKSQLWNMVNELTTARKNEQPPEIEIALYHYGHSTLPVTAGYVGQIAELTTDLDLISEKLFALSTAGGEEYCGHAIQTSLDQLTWSDNAEDLKMIFIAGNESFGQGQTDFRTSCQNAIGNGVVVNTIFCGAHESGIASSWKEGADLAEGKYLSIDHNSQVVHIATPFDDQMASLNTRLNDTYIGFGSAGADNIARQQEQDRNAANYGQSNMSSRAATKASANYLNTSWDLVDAWRADNDVLKNVKTDQLPENMQKMAPAEQKAFIERNYNSRNEIRNEINEVNEKRQDFITQERKKLSETNTLDNAMINTIRELANDNNFVFE